MHPHTRREILHRGLKTVRCVHTSSGITLLQQVAGNIAPNHVLAIKSARIGPCLYVSHVRHTSLAQNSDSRLVVHLVVRTLSFCQFRASHESMPLSLTRNTIIPANIALVNTNASYRNQKAAQPDHRVGLGASLKDRRLPHLRSANQGALRTARNPTCCACRKAFRRCSPTRDRTGSLRPRTALKGQSQSPLRPLPYHKSGEPASISGVLKPESSVRPTFPWSPNHKPINTASQTTILAKALDDWRLSRQFDLHPVIRTQDWHQ